jgi:hypothetical protein
MKGYENMSDMKKDLNINIDELKAKRLEKLDKKHREMFNKKVSNKTSEDEKILKAFEELRKIMSCEDEESDYKDSNILEVNTMCAFLEGLDLDSLNEYQKNKFNWLKYGEYDEKACIKYWRLLNHLTDIENKLGKDLYDFNRKEIIDVIKSVELAEEKTKLFNVIDEYINWMVEKGYNMIGNPCDCITDDMFIN